MNEEYKEDFPKGKYVFFGILIMALIVFMGAFMTNCYKSIKPNNNESIKRNKIDNGCESDSSTSITRNPR